MDSTLGILIALSKRTGQPDKGLLAQYLERKALEEQKKIADLKNQPAKQKHQTRYRGSFVFSQGVTASLRLV